MSEAKCCGESASGSSRENPAGTTSLRYRIGTQPTFLRAMVQALPRERVLLDDGTVARPLEALTTRAVSDGTIALLDAWASALDVLTFYGERIQNESYLATAVEQRSVRELAQMIGYVPAPGVAASTRLAFSVDASAPETGVTVASNWPVMSVPAQGELPQTFETSAALEARAAWNELRPLARKPQVIVEGTVQLYLHGLATRLVPGSPIVVVGKEREDAPDKSERWDLRMVVHVETVPEQDHTLVTLDRPLGDGHTDPAASPQRVITFRARAALFGAAAPDVRIMPKEVQDQLAKSDQAGKSPRWRGFYMSEDPAVAHTAIDLDRDYANVVVDSFVCLQDRVEVELYKVLKVSPQARTDFSLAGKCTRVFLDSAQHLEDFKRRSTVVHIESEELRRAEAPLLDHVSGSVIELDRAIPELPPGRELIFAGIDADTGEPTSELAIVKACRAGSGGVHSEIELMTGLRSSYVRATLVIHGNVVVATHGTSGMELLGSGNGALSHQRFRLRGKPLTWVPARTAGGAESTLRVRVNGVLWYETPSLHDHGPLDQVYVRTTDSEGVTTLEFGDGKRGARLPSGVNNVSADYRQGLGLAAEVEAGQLTLLQRRPLGVRAVLNPQAASGAADPELLADTRHNAPLRVLTFDRLVSVQDYEDFARAFAGIGKARASQLWDGKRSFVHLTVASASGGAIAEASQTFAALTDSLARFGDPAHVVTVSSHDQVGFGAHLNLLLDPAHVDTAGEAVHAALRAAFSYEQRQFGEPVTADQIVSVAQNVAGVIAVDLDTLFRDKTSKEYRSRLTARRASWSGAGVTKAELLVIDPVQVTLGKMG